MKVIGHKYISNEFGWPILIQLLEFSQEGYAAFWIREHWKAVNAVAGDKV
jgi:hypothetical protein